MSSISNRFSPLCGLNVDPDNLQDRSNSEVITRQMTDEEKELYGDVKNYKKPCTAGILKIREDDKSMGKIDKSRLIEILKEDGFTKKAYIKAAKEFGVTDHGVACFVSNNKIKKEITGESKDEKKVLKNNPQTDESLSSGAEDTKPVNPIIDDEADILGKIKAIVAENRELKEKISVLKSCIKESVDSASQLKAMLEEILINIA